MDLQHIPDNYNGVTIIMSLASRHDKDELITGYAGDFFWNAIYPIKRTECHIKVLSEFREPFLPGTRLVLLLGEPALQAYNPKANLNSYRGSPWLADGIIYLSSYAPQDAFDRRNYASDENEKEAESDTDKGHTKTKRSNWRTWLKWDLKKCTRLLKDGIKSFPNYGSAIYPGIAGVIYILTHTVNRILFLDIETDSQRNLTCIGFKFDASITYVIPWKLYNETLAYDQDHLLHFLVALNVAMQHNRVVIHNALFDLTVLAYRYHICPGKDVYDTMLSWHRCYPEIEMSLGHLVSYFTDEPYHKDEGVFEPKNAEQDRQLWLYNAKDIRTMEIVYNELQAEEKKLTGLPSSIKLANSCITPYLTAMLQGIRVDPDLICHKIDNAGRRTEQLERILTILAGHPLNPRSPKQVSKYLYEELGNPKPDDDPTNEKQLLKLINKRQIPAVNVILAARHESKLGSALKFRLWRENRCTTAYKISGTDTFRLASKSLFKFRGEKGYGTNLQNQSKQNRDVFIPDPGKVFIQVDQAGAEALVVAYLVRHGRFRELFLAGIKPHVYLTMVLFADKWQAELGFDIQDYLQASPHILTTLPRWQELEKACKSNQLRYDTAKMVIHAGNYDMKGPTMQEQAMVKSENTLVLSVRECNQYLDQRRRLFPEFIAWHEETRTTVQRSRVLHNLFGHPRRFTGPFDDALWRKAYAFVPQSTVGCITHLAWAEIQQEIDQGQHKGLDLLVNGHDSILAQCPEENAIMYAAIIADHLERDLISPRGEKFKMKTETQYSRTNWKEMKNNL